MSIPVIGSTYVHYKGGRYIVEHIAKDCAFPDNLVVVYRSLKTNELWVRTQLDWCSQVVVDGSTVDRFTLEQ